MNKDIVVGLICITLMCLGIGITALMHGGDKSFEVALASLNGASLIGGWLGRTAYDKIKEEGK